MPASPRSRRAPRGLSFFATGDVTMCPSRYTSEPRPAWANRRAMGTTNRDAGTRVDEISDGIYRISTPVPPSAVPGGFTFNQYLVVDDEPLLFHTGPRKMFPLVREAIASIMPVER